jgi:hypothetical protein
MNESILKESGFFYRVTYLEWTITRSTTLAFVYPVKIWETQFRVLNDDHLVWCWLKDHEWMISPKGNIPCFWDNLSQSKQFSINNDYDKIRICKGLVYLSHNLGSENYKSKLDCRLTDLVSKSLVCSDKNKILSERWKVCEKKKKKKNCEGFLWQTHNTGLEKYQEQARLIFKSLVSKNYCSGRTKN